MQLCDCLRLKLRFTSLQGEGGGDDPHLVVVVSARDGVAIPELPAFRVYSLGFRV